MAAQWGKLDDRVFDYYILCDYLLSKDYLYLLLNKGREGIVVRYNKKKGYWNYVFSTLFLSLVIDTLY